MRLSVFTLACALAAAAFCSRPAHAEEPTNRTWLWADPKPPVAARHVSMEVVRGDNESRSAELTLRCAIKSDLGVHNTRVRFEIWGADGRLLGESEQRLDVLAGANTCTIRFDGSALALGTYEARISLRHTQLLDEPSQSFIIRKVNADELLAEIGVLRERLTGLETALRAEREGNRHLPYLNLKVALAGDVLKLAEGNGVNGEWESLEPRLRYVRERLNGVHAGLVFGGVSPERQSGEDLPALNDVTLEQSGFAVAGRPVFLVGGALPALDPEGLAQLQRLQLNAATVTVGAEDKPGAVENIPALAGRLRDVFDRAVAENVAMFAQFAPEQLAPDFLAANPQVLHDGQVDIGRPESREAWESFFARIAPALHGQPMLTGASLARNPTFHFDGLEVRDGFLEYLRAHYPDRMTLNRAWRAHLAQLEDIVLWSTGKFDTYQTHRPYQFDWQTYHQSLGNEWFDWSRRLAEAHLAGVPLGATLPDTAFATGETRYSVNRERLASLLGLSACASTTSAEDPVYAMAYPAQSAYYTLLKSIRPDLPVVDLNHGVRLPDDLDPTRLFRFTHASVWDGVLSGLNGLTVPMDSLMFQQPEALEGYATAAVDVNRLAPIIRAFQQAPADVGILFSASSKVFDDGEPHLESAINAYEGASFGGYHVRFVTEDQCANGVLDSLKILVLPNTPALGDKAFEKISEYVDGGGTVARTGAPIPYDEQGFSRGDLIRNTSTTVLVRGLNLPTEYLHAMDAATVLGALPQIPRAITPQGYPIEGVKTRFVEYDGGAYLYMVNIRKEPVYVTLATGITRGRDLIHGQDMEFPATLEPLVPRLLKLEPRNLEMTVTASGEGA